MKKALIKELSVVEIKQQIDSIGLDLVNMRLRQSTSQVENPHKLKLLRHEIARLRTFHQQKFN